jgi:hypothetical protein
MSIGAAALRRYPTGQLDRHRHRRCRRTSRLVYIFPPTQKLLCVANVLVGAITMLPLCYSGRDSADWGRLSLWRAVLPFVDWHQQ